MEFYGGFLARFVKITDYFLLFMSLIVKITCQENSDKCTETLAWR